MLQVWVSASGGHTCPPLAAGVVTARARPCVPPPQVFEHGVQSVQGPTAQLTGTTHAIGLHASDSVSTGQDFPAFSAGLVTVRLWLRVPPPQSFVQADQGPQALT